MISADYVVEQLCRMMGNSKEIYGIDWSRDSQNGYRTIVNGVGLYLIEHQGRDPSLCLFLFKSGTRVRIIEPKIHLSQAPIGKFLRMTTSAAGINSWPKPPETPKEKANERLRVALNSLYARVSEQDDLRKADAFLSKDLHEGIASGMFRQNFFDCTENQYNDSVSQQLFRDLLRLKAENQ